MLAWLRCPIKKTRGQVEEEVTYIIKEKDMINWIKDRWSERTSKDGAVLIGAGVIFLLFKPLGVIAAWVAIGYGAWTIYKEES